MSISESDAAQNERMAEMGAQIRSCGRSIDVVRENLQKHEDVCRENWKEQRAATSKMQTQMKLILWVLGGLATAVAGAGAEYLFNHVIGG